MTASDTYENKGNKTGKGGRTSANTETDGGTFNATADNAIYGKHAVPEEPLDLADLDLSRLRLSKKDLETLSSITPGLPKCFQEQLLAKLPPTQARKLSRTLSMQNSPLVTTVKLYKRSQSGGRTTLPESTILAAPPPDDLKENVAEEAAEGASGGGGNRTSDDSSELTYKPSLYRRSVSRSRYDCDTSVTPTGDSAAAKSRSSSVCRDDYGKSLCSTAAYTSDINDKYKYYSPYLNKSIKDSSSTESGSVSPQKRYGGTTLREATAAALGRPPSGCLSPPLQSVPSHMADSGINSLHRRTTQRHRISRFLRPDFFDEQPLEENPYQREKRLRERETQSVLREIREKTRDSSRERPSARDDELQRRKHSLPNEELDLETKSPSKHVRNKSMEVYAGSRQEDSAIPREATKGHRRSLSRPRDITEEMDKRELADKILQELQLLSAVRSQQEKQRLSVPREVSVERTTEIITQTLPRNSEVGTTTINDDESSKPLTGTIKKVKKIKPKENSSDDIIPEASSKTTTTTTMVKKIRKIVKKSEPTKPQNTECVDQVEASTLPPAVEANTNGKAVDAIETPKKESKLKRPKSYPTKEGTPAVGGAAAKTEMLLSKLPMKQTPIVTSGTKPESIDSSQLPTVVNCTTSANGPARGESRLIRPKSYPASKLVPPKDVKKATRSGIAIATISETSHISNKSNSASAQSNSEEKSVPTTPSLLRASIETSSSSDTRPSTVKKIIKVTKKSKLVPPTPVTPPTPNTTTNSSTGDEDSKESSPTVREQLKEKSPEKKHGKGLLYAIGQKFEKLRDSAMHKEKKAAAAAAAAAVVVAGGGSSSNSSTATTNSLKKSSPENSSPEKIKAKTSLLKKKSTKTDKSNIATASDTTKNVSPAAAGVAKPAPKDKRSRIDAMIRSLRERSLPRSNAATSESNYIKRAVSVEEMPGTFNRNAVNRVLGLFKRFEKDGSERRVRNTRSTSNIERQLRELTPSPIYQNATVKCTTTANAPSTVIRKDLGSQPQCSCELSPPASKSPQPITCPECIQHQSAAKHREETPKPATTEAAGTQQPVANGYGNRDKRKGLMLDLSKLENASVNANTNTNASRTAKASAYINGNGIYSNLPPYPNAINSIKSSSNNSSSIQSMENASNNNNNNNNSCIMNNNSCSMQTSQTSGYRTSSAHEINRNHLLTPSNENIANYSSDSRSYQDDCASTSTFLSPTEEPELCFDNWSICSEDNYMLHATPSPTVSRLSRVSQFSSPTRGGESSDPNESVIDRIKRRSFYCRFNEKKPKRTSSIVGPAAVRDYYREQKAAVNARSNNKLNQAGERVSSPDITQEFFRPLKLSPAGTELKPPVYKSFHEYNSSTVGKSRKSLNDIRPTISAAISPSFHSKRLGATLGADSDYLSLHGTVPTRYKSSSSSSPYESNGAIGGTSNSYYSTYNPKRRSSYTLNGTLPSGTGAGHTGSSHLDGYATVGRRSIRPYDHRTMSLLDPSLTAGSASYRRETRTPVRDYTTASISRSNSRYRNSSASRSPTNI